MKHLLKIVYYIGRFKEESKTIFLRKYIDKCGIRFCIYNFICFLCHRSDSRLQLWAERKKDMIVQTYLYEHYDYVIKRYGDITAGN